MPQRRRQPVSAGFPFVGAVPCRDRAQCGRERPASHSGPGGPGGPAGFAAILPAPLRSAPLRSPAPLRSAAIRAAPAQHAALLHAPATSAAIRAVPGWRAALVRVPCLPRRRRTAAFSPAPLVSAPAGALPHLARSIAAVAVSPLIVSPALRPARPPGRAAVRHGLSVFADHGDTPARGGARPGDRREIARSTRRDRAEPSDLTR